MSGLARPLSSVGPTLENVPLSVSADADAVVTGRRRTHRTAVAGAGDKKRVVSCSVIVVSGINGLLHGDVVPLKIKLSFTTGSLIFEDGSDAV